jgi:hypothetical protein
VRYRLSEHCFLAHWCGKLIPNPDLWLILNAPPTTLVARKGEITIDAAERLTTGYRNLATHLSNAQIVDTGGSLDETMAFALEVVNSHLAKRMIPRVN